MTQRTKNYKISERTIRSIEEGKEVKLSTAENYSTILGYSVDELANDPALVDSRELEIDISKTKFLDPAVKSYLKIGGRITAMKISLLGMTLILFEAQSER